MILDVRLREEDHIYLDSKNKTYMSATTIIGNYKEKFDPFKIMKNGRTLIDNYVDKNGGSVEYWLKEWERKKNSACFDGTMFHKFQEDTVNYEKFLDHNFRKYPVRDFEKIVKADPELSYKTLPDGAYMELTIFNRKFMVAGQADKVIKDGDFIDIDDYKTNSSFTKLSYQHPRTKKFKMMNYPCNKLMDCHLGHYTVQLNIYAWMLSQFGLKPRNLRLLYYALSEEDRENLRNGQDMSYLTPEIIPIEVNLPLAESVIKHNNVTFRKSSRSDMFLV